MAAQHAATTVLSWNVAGRVRSVPAQAAALATCRADVVALQEIRVSALAAWRSELRALGYPHVVTSWDARARAAPPPSPERRLGVLVAARVPLAPRRPPPVPWPERLAAVAVDGGAGPFELLVCHAPLSSRAEEVKVRTLEAVVAHLAPPSGAPRVLVGDLNTPQYESREGEVRSFARTRTGNLRADYGERHDRAELGVVPGLADHGYADAFRLLHGYDRRDRSWLYPNGKTGYRLDHAFVRGLGVDGCDYVHAWREQRLSDHSALWVRLRARAR